MVVKLKKRLSPLPYGKEEQKPCRFLKLFHVLNYSSVTTNDEEEEGGGGRGTVLIKI